VPGLNPARRGGSAGSPSRTATGRGAGTNSRGQDDPRDLAIQYRRLAEIGACFRANRHDLGIRPVFHLKVRLVLAQIAIRYMAFRCLQHVRHRLAAQGHRMGPDRIRRTPNGLLTSILHETKGSRRFGLPGAASADARRINRALGLNRNRAPFIHARKSRETAS